MSQVPLFGRLFLICITSVTYFTLQPPSCTSVNERQQAAAWGTRSARQGPAETNTLCNETKAVTTAACQQSAPRCLKTAGFGVTSAGKLLRISFASEQKESIKVPATASAA